MSFFIFGKGSAGRNVMVDASGALVANAGQGTYLPFSNGDTGRTVCVDASGRLMVNLDGSGGESNTASNLGSGNVEIFAQKVGSDLQFRSLTAGSGIQLVQSANAIQIKEQMLIAKPFKILTAVSGNMTVDLAQYNNYYMAMGVNNTIFNSLTNPVDGGKYFFVFKQNNAGSKTITFPSSVKWVGGTAIALTAASGSIDACTLVYLATLGIYVAAPGLDCK